MAGIQVGRVSEDTLWLYGKSMILRDCVLLILWIMLCFRETGLLWMDTRKRSDNFEEERNMIWIRQRYYRQ